GRMLLDRRISAETLPLSDFVDDVQHSKPVRVSGSAVFLSSTRRGTPNVLLHHFKHNKVLHKQVLILSIVTDAVPDVADDDKVRFKDFGQGFWAVTAHYGFKESPSILDVMARCKAHGMPINEAD